MWIQHIIFIVQSKHMFLQMQTSLAKNYIYLHTDTGEYCGKSNVRNGKNIQVHSVFEFDLNSWIAWKRISQIEIIHTSRSGSNGNNILVLVFWTWKIHRYLCMSLSCLLAYSLHSRSFFGNRIHLHSVHATIFQHILAYHKTVEVNAKKIKFDTFFHAFCCLLLNLLNLFRFACFVHRF